MAKEIDSLTRDVLAAKAAGLSYGKYKALQHERRPMVAVKAPPDPREAKLRYEVTCVICGKVFKAARKCRKYCSDYCTQTAQHEQRARAKEAARNGGQ